MGIVVIHSYLTFRPPHFDAGSRHQPPPQSLADIKTAGHVMVVMLALDPDQFFDFVFGHIPNSHEPHLRQNMVNSFWSLKHQVLVSEL